MVKRFKLACTFVLLLAIFFILPTAGQVSAHNAQESGKLSPQGRAPSSCQTVQNQNYGSYTVLFAPHALTIGQCLIENPYELVMQADGNLVIYNTSISGWQQAVWATNTPNSGAVHAVMQYDGNFVLYTSSGHAVWASNTSQYKARCQNACNLGLSQCGALGIDVPPDGHIWLVNTKNC